MGGNQVKTKVFTGQDYRILSFGLCWSLWMHLIQLLLCFQIMN